MLSKPLACASTLDQTPIDCAVASICPTWRRFGARASACLLANAHAKANADIPALIQARRAEESFSLRRGLDSSYVFFKLGITSGLRSVFASETTKATRWVALDP